MNHKILSLLARSRAFAANDRRKPQISQDVLRRKGLDPIGQKHFRLKFNSLKVFLIHGFRCGEWETPRLPETANKITMIAIVTTPIMAAVGYSLLYLLLGGGLGGAILIFIVAKMLGK